MDFLATVGLALGDKPTMITTCGRKYSVGGFPETHTNVSDSPGNDTDLRHKHHRTAVVFLHGRS